MEPWYVTGADSNSYLHVQALLASFARHSPRSHLQVCDFGLHPTQRDALQAGGVLVHRPGAVPAGAPWPRCFTAMHHYRPQAQTLVWLDPASLVVGPIAQAVEGLVRSWGPEPRVALVHDAETPTFSDVLDGERLQAFGLDAHRDFFDTRMVITRAPSLWRELALLSPRLAPVGNSHQLWFNLLVTTQAIAVQPMDSRGLLRSHEACARLVRRGSRVMDGDTPVLLVHPDGASTTERHVQQGIFQRWQRFDAPALAGLQEEALHRPHQAQALTVTA